MPILKQFSQQGGFMLENGKEYCDCPKKKCKRHGNCNKCTEHHAPKLPRCKREKHNSALLKLFGKK